MASSSKNTGAIVIGVIILIGIVIIFGYHYLGWFGGKEKSNDGDVCVYASEPAYIEGTWKDGKCVIGNSGSNSHTAYALGGRINNPNVNRIKKQIQGIYDSKGTTVGGYNQKKNTCASSCAESGAIGWGVEQYPKDSIYYPHYWCYCIRAAQ